MKYILLILFYLGSYKVQDNDYQSKEDPVDFWNQFIDFIESKSNNQFEQFIEFPISIECYLNGQQGKEIKSIEEFISVKDQVFSEVFLAQLYDFSPTQAINEYKRVYHNDKSQIFIYEVSIQEGLGEEMGIHYKFSRVNKAWKLVEVYCVG